MKGLIMENETTKLIQNHRSIRKYTNKPISDEILQSLLTSAQWAPSSHNVQAYSIIVIKSPETKRKLSELCGSQKYVETCPVFFVFCADFYRLKLTSEIHSTNFEIDEVENLLVGSVDTALAAQNVFISAKSFGLGGVMIGGIRNHPEEVSKLLQLPSLTIPIMGMCLGYPAEEPWQKPRLPQHTVVHEERYQTEHIGKGLEEYEVISADYYTRRTNGRRTNGWTEQMSEYLSNPRRPHLKSFIINQGIHLK
jgi:nitroreductase